MMASNSESRKVLVVEDEPAISSLLDGLLRKLGCQGEVATDGRQALAMIRRSEFDAVLLDLRCSNLQAKDVVFGIQELRPSLLGRVLVITGEVHDKEAMELIEHFFLLEIPRHRLLEDAAGRLRALLRIAPSPTRLRL
jgi:CheY-like chemotaxis protein